VDCGRYNILPSKNVLSIRNNEIRQKYLKTVQLSSTGRDRELLSKFRHTQSDQEINDTLQYVVVHWRLITTNVTRTK